MRSLKVLRVLFAALAILFMVFAFLPAFSGDRPDWMMIAILILFVVMIPASLIGSAKMENFPNMLPAAGYIRFNIVFGTVLAVASAVMVVMRLRDGLSPWMYLAAVFAFAEIAVNNMIHYKIKTQSGEDQA